MKFILLFLLSACSPGFESEVSRAPKEPLQCEGALELADRISLDKTQSRKEIIYSKETRVSRGDIFLIQISAEVTNDLGHDVMVGYYVQRTLNGNTKVLRHSVVGNITPNMHHWPYDITRADFVDEDGLARYDFVMYAAAMIEKPGDFIIVEQCYGGMDIIKIPKEGK